MLPPNPFVSDKGGSAITIRTIIIKIGVSIIGALRKQQPLIVWPQTYIGTLGVEVSGATSATGI